MRHLVERGLLFVISTFFRALPGSLRSGLGSLVGRALYRMAARRRRLTLRNLDLAYGRELTRAQKEAIARESFSSLGRNLAEFFGFPGLTPAGLDRLLTWRGIEHLDRAVGEGRGVLVLSAHLGNWDLLGAAVAMKGYPLSLISKVSRSEAVNRLWMQYRRQTGVRIFTGKGTMKEILRHLRAGGIVGFVLDQNALPEDGVFVPFFGHPACTLDSLAVLARRTGAPVLPMHTYRIRDRHVVEVEPPLEWEERPEAEEDILGRTAQYARWTEEVIRRHPGQWTWLHDRWKTRPAGEAGMEKKGKGEAAPIA